MADTTNGNNETGDIPEIELIIKVNSGTSWRVEFAYFGIHFLSWHLTRKCQEHLLHFRAI